MRKIIKNMQNVLGDKKNRKAMKNILLKNHFLFNSVNFSIFIDGHN
jgi:hypothetical protein